MEFLFQMSEETIWEKFKKGLIEEKISPLDLLNKENYIDEQTSKDRFNICNSCEKFIKLTHQCKECGCFMQLKTKLIKASCPLGKW